MITSLHALPSRFALFLILTATACSSGGGNDAPSTSGGNEVVATGTLALTGADTGAIGTALEIGDVALIRDAGQPDTYFCVDRDSRIRGFEYSLLQRPDELSQNLTIADPLDTFVLNAISGGLDGVSMTILVNGVSYEYLCTGCAGLSFDPASNTILFEDVTVAPAASASTGPLVLDGMIVYGIPE